MYEGDRGSTFPCASAEKRSASGFLMYIDNKLTRGGPEVTNQATNDDGERHKVQPERLVVLQIR